MLYIMTPEVKRMELKYKRILLKLSGEALAGEKKTNFKFKAKAFPTGKYTLNIIGEAFTAEQKFFILN